MQCIELISMEPLHFFKEFPQVKTFLDSSYESESIAKIKSNCGSANHEHFQMLEMLAAVKQKHSGRKQ